MKYCCVIGGSGFIGKHLVSQLKATGRNIKVIGRNAVSPFDDSIVYLSDKFSENDFLINALKDVNEVIELAYSTTPQTSFENPVKDIFDNLAVSVKVFESILTADVKKVVYVSSGGTIYGEANYIPIDEKHPTNPVSPYGITKLAIEKYAQMFYHTRGLPITIVRPSNAFGIGQKPFVGQGFISTAIATILKNEPVKIFGKQGSVRDYIYVTDIANGIVAALENGEVGQCYNIGSEQGRNNLDVLESLEPLMKNFGYNIEIQNLPERLFDVKTNVLSSEKLKSISGWMPQLSFDNALNKTLESIINTQRNTSESVK